MWLMVGMTNAEKVALVIDLIEQGESERSACQKAGIARSTFRTTALRQEMGDQYAKALIALAHDQIESGNKVIDEMRDGELDPVVGRLELDWRKWMASKLLPRQYGDKIEQVHSGGVELTQITRRIVDPREG
jgi:hypothetical protein